MGGGRERRRENICIFKSVIRNDKRRERVLIRETKTVRVCACVYACVYILQAIAISRWQNRRIDVSPWVYNIPLHGSSMQTRSFLKLGSIPVSKTG